MEVAVKEAKKDQRDGPRRDELEPRGHDWVDKSVEERLGKGRIDPRPRYVKGRNVGTVRDNIPRAWSDLTQLSSTIVTFARTYPGLKWKQYEGDDRC